MKIYSVDESIPRPAYMTGGGFENFQQQDKDYIARIKEWLIGLGYTGKNTGKTVYFPVADGAATYMLAEGSKSFLVHVDIGDAYAEPMVQYMPKKAIMEQITRQEGLAKLFRR